jgi:pyrroline-5-carboxylate reductase
MTAIKPNEKIGFVGAGNIAEALIRGLIAAGVAQAKQIFAADVSAARVEAVRSRYKVHTSTDNVRTAQQCHVVVLAVKPQTEGLSGVGRDPNHQLVVSVVAGVTTDRSTVAGRPGRSCAS